MGFFFFFFSLVSLHSTILLLVKFKLDKYLVNMRGITETGNTYFGMTCVCAIM